MFLLTYNLVHYYDLTRTVDLKVDFNDQVSVKVIETQNHAFEPFRGRV